MSMEPDTRYVRGYRAIAHRLGWPLETTRRHGRAGHLPIIRLSQRRVQARPEALDAYAAEVEARGGVIEVPR